MSIFKGGIPIAPDVEKLFAAYGDVALGTVIKHEQIEAVLGKERSSHRYRTVVTAFRKRMLAVSRRVLDGRCVAGQGYKVLTSEQTVGHLAAEQDGVRRKVGVWRLKGATVDEHDLSEVGRSGFEMEKRVIAAMHVALIPTRLPALKKLVSGS